MDCSYNEYVDQMDNDNLIDIEHDGLVYRFDINNEDKKCYEVMDSKIYKYTFKPEGTVTSSAFEYLEPKKYLYQYSLFRNYFEQRPDAELVYYDTNEKLEKLSVEYDNIKTSLTLIEAILNYSNYDEVKEQYDIVLSEKDRVESLIIKYEQRMDKIINDIFDYNDSIDELKVINNKIQQFEYDNIDLESSEYYQEQLETKTSQDDIEYYSSLVSLAQRHELMIEKRELLNQKIRNHICSAVTLNDIDDELKGYNSSYGIVPAGEWDTFNNPYYEGEGCITGLIGAYEGPQGRETGYDSRKGYEKLNYKDPDRALLKLLSEVTDENGNILYPMESFEKGGEYYYHIFGVNYDGSINWNLVNNPRFGCKMLGNYMIVGVGPNSDDGNCYNRLRGSKVVTSSGLAIVVDYGARSEIETDLGHIDINVDEVLFWLKDFSHNQDRQVQSLAGIYDWCTPEDYCGTVDVNYEHMERNYVNNLNEMYNTNFICIFDREDFENETSYDNQEEFVYKLKKNLS